MLVKRGHRRAAATLAALPLFLIPSAASTQPADGLQPPKTQIVLLGTGTPGPEEPPHLVARAGRVRAAG